MLNRNRKKFPSVIAIRLKAGEARRGTEACLRAVAKGFGRRRPVGRGEADAEEIAAVESINNIR